jgi:hypothetical protein
VPHVSPFLRDMGLSRTTSPKQSPRLPVIIKRRRAQVRVDVQDLARSERGQRQNVPKVLGDDVAGDEINFVDGVWNVADARSLDAIRRPAPCRLDLHPPQKMAAGEDEVEAVTVSPGFGHAETQADGLKKECDLGNFSAALEWKFVPALRFTANTADGGAFMPDFGLSENAHTPQLCHSDRSGLPRER